MALQMKIKDLIGDLVRAQIPLQPDPARCAEAAAEAASALGGNAIGLPARAVDQPDRFDLVGIGQFKQHFVRLTGLFPEHGCQVQNAFSEPFPQLMAQRERQGRHPVEFADPLLENGVQDLIEAVPGPSVLGDKRFQPVIFGFHDDPSSDRHQRHGDPGAPQEGIKRGAG